MISEIKIENSVNKHRTKKATCGHFVLLVPPQLVHSRGLFIPYFSTITRTTKELLEKVYSKQLIAKFVDVNNRVNYFKDGDLVSEGLFLPAEKVHREFKVDLPKMNRDDLIATGILTSESSAVIMDARYMIPRNGSFHYDIFELPVGPISRKRKKNKLIEYIDLDPLTHPRNKHRRDTESYLKLGPSVQFNDKVSKVSDLIAGVKLEGERLDLCSFKVASGSLKSPMLPKVIYSGQGTPEDILRRCGALCSSQESIYGTHPIMRLGIQLRNAADFSTETFIYRSPNYLMSCSDSVFWTKEVY
jgi:hypothetical protein